MMDYPDHETYRKLYAKYVQSPVKLLDFAESLTGKTVIDLCGGEGKIALEAKKRGAKTVLLIDGEEDMVNMQALDDFGIWFQSHDLRNFIVKYILECSYGECDESGNCSCFHCETGFDGADYVFCRQAVNYWLWDDKAAKNVSRLLRSGGKFIFNTFNTKPEVEPVVKEYGLGDLSGEWTEYVEVHWLVGDMVHHVQIREGMEPHFTKFKWIPPERFRELLSPYFDVREDVEGKTSIYTCTRI